MGRLIGRLSRTLYFPGARARLFRRIGWLFINFLLGAWLVASLIGSNSYGLGTTLLRDPETRRILGPLLFFRSCHVVHAVGAAPLLRGEPGYSRHLDADGDGVACELLPRRW